MKAYLTNLNPRLRGIFDIPTFLFFGIVQVIVRSTLIKKTKKISKFFWGGISQLANSPPCARLSQKSKKLEYQKSLLTLDLHGGAPKSLHSHIFNFYSFRVKLRTLSFQQLKLHLYAPFWLSQIRFKWNQYVENIRSS